MTYALVQSIEITANVSRVFVERCISGIEANRERSRANAERSPALATALAPVIGYDEAAKLAKEALERDQTIRDLVVEKGLLSEKEADEALDPERMT